jgi:hypothetical protein
LGGEYAIEPFLTAGIALGPFDSSARWHMNGSSTVTNIHVSRIRGAPGHRLSCLTVVYPLLELVTVTRHAVLLITRRLAPQTQVYVVPGSTSVHVLV